MNILIAEDEPLMLKTIELRLKKDGHNVIACVDGKSALEQISTQELDLIITDIMLPYISGVEVIGAAKSNAHKTIPVIVMSSMGQEKMIEQAFELGADDYITKPFNLAELSSRVKRFIKNQTLNAST